MNREGPQAGFGGHHQAGCNPGTERELDPVASLKAIDTEGSRDRCSRPGAQKAHLSWEGVDMPSVELACHRNP